jgi:hypothetical protein
MAAPTVYRPFGRMRHWHLVDASPTGSIDERAAALLKMAHEMPANHKKRKIQPLQIRAMALDLVAAAQLGEPSGHDLLRLLAWGMNVPEAFLKDNSGVLSGRDGKGQGVDAGVRDGAELLDWQYYQTHGKFMSINALAKKARIHRRQQGEVFSGVPGGPR